MARTPVALSKIEIAVIRNLLGRDSATNQNILGQINGKRRAEGLPETNGGRISEVRNNHERYNGVPPASDDEVQDFFSTSTTISQLDISKPSPINENLLRQLFPLRARTGDTLNITETSVVECKASFTKSFFSNCHKAIAAFANNQGGYILFGIENESWQISGINADNFRRLDRASLSNALRDHFSSEIRFEMTALAYGEKTVGILYIHKARTRPVICLSNQGDVSIGQIYYRYDAANRLISATELQQIINERVSEQSQSLLGKHLENIVSNGVENSAVLNLTTGEVHGKAGKFLLDKNMLSDIAFVKEGEFVENSDSPALTIVGEVKETVISNLDRYPFSYKVVLKQIKNKFPNLKQYEFNSLIRDNNIKDDRSYSSCRYTSITKQRQFDRNGIVSPGPTYIYNQAAVDLLLSKAKHLNA